MLYSNAVDDQVMDFEQSCHVLVNKCYRFHVRITLRV